jgi:hypothetical protein
VLGRYSLGDKMTWKFAGAVGDGEEFKINGVNVWSQKWAPVKGEFADVKDPSYKQDFRFEVYTINNGAVAIKFAAGEFSNCIWGFYVMAEKSNKSNSLVSFLRKYLGF